MFGTFRFALAWMVVASHLLGQPELTHLGTYAVRAFFVISGFSLTFALNEVYRFDLSSYATNRMLRLLPGYFFICIATYAVIVVAPHHAAAFSPRWEEQPSTWQLVQNFLMLPLAFGNLSYRLFEPGWSLAVESVMYLFLWLGIARSRSTALLLLACGAAYDLVMIADAEPFAARFYTLPAAMLSFSIGAYLYFLKKNDERSIGEPRNLLIFGMYAAIINGVIATYSQSELGVHIIGYYINLICCVLIVIGLASLKPQGRIATLDTWLGHLAYPVFLLQWLGGFLAHEIFATNHVRGLELFALAVPVIFGLALPLAMAQVRFIDPLRYAIRSRKPAAAEGGDGPGLTVPQVN